MNKQCQIKLQVLIFPINLRRFLAIAKSHFRVREEDAGTVRASRQFGDGFLQ